MTILTRNQIKTPALPKEAVPVPTMGGDVIVRGMLLSERMELSALGAALSEPMPGENAAQIAHRVGRQVVMLTLARAVVLEDGEPVYTADQWDAFGAEDPEAVLMLYRKARALSGHTDPDPQAGEGTAVKN